MKSVTIRDLRHRWPETERALQVENEILITRDSKPAAKLVSVSPAEKPRPRWDAGEHARWQKKVAGRKISRRDELLVENRADRTFARRRK